MAKSFEQIITDVIANINQTIGQVDTRIGTVLRDAILTPLSNELSLLYLENDKISNNQSVLTIDTNDNAAIDKLSGNFGINRLVGTSASGIVRFYRGNLSSNSSISIPIFTTVSTPSYPAITYKTMATRTLTTANFDTDLQAYYVDIPVLCDQVGIIGNAAIGAISVTSLRGIDGVINYSDFTTGTDAQSNTDVIQTVSSTARGNAGTDYGYDSIIRQNFVVRDVSVINPESPYSLNSQSGITDIIVLSDHTITAVDSVVYVNASTTKEVIPLLRPVTAVSEISGTASVGGVDTPYVLTQGPTGDYEVFYDTASIYAYSGNSISKIYLHVQPTSNLMNNSFLNITYKYSDVVNDIQVFLSQPKYNSVGSNILVKYSNSLPVLINAGIKVISGYDSTDVRNTVITAVVNYLNSFLLGKAMQSSDVIAIIAAVPGVESVNVPTFKMSISTAPLSYLQNIAPSPRQYINTVSDNITITVEA